jgi:membrane protein YdbS with pleckstrin-like domain
MRDHPHGEDTSHSDIWVGRATNRVQWLPALAGAACIALGIELAVDSQWTSGIAALAMSVVGCIAAGLLIVFGTLAFVHVAVKVDKDCLEVRCGHIGLPRRRIPLSHVVGADFEPRVTPRQWGGWGYRWRPEMGTAVIVRRGEGVVLRLGDGHTFTITVDNAEAAVRIIRDRLRSAGPGPGAVV